MNNLQFEIGKRLQEVRNIYNNGYKAGIEQFAAELGENKFNISNYENGKANVPPRILVALYEKGFNPVYVLTGSGDIYADNENGRLRRNNTASDDIPSAEIIGTLDLRGMSFDELNERASRYIAAAGDIMKVLKEKSK